MNYDKWQQTISKVGGLFLDPENPRLAPGTNVASERDIIEALVIHEDVYTLAKNIAANGFFPSEPLVAIRQTGKLTVVEGNRRLAACKLLAAPEAAPQEVEKKFRTLAATFDVKQLAKLPVLIAPSREATIPLVMARHTATQIAKWKPAMQAHFYSNLVRHGLTLEEVAEKFNLQPGEVRDALHLHNLYKMACRLQLSQEEADVVRDPHRFNLTTLHRVFETPTGRGFFGIDFGVDGNISGKIAPEEFAKGFTRLVSDVAMTREDSRSLHAPADIQNYLGRFKPSERPNLARKGLFTADSFLLPTRVAAPTPLPPPPRRRRVRASAGLIPYSIVCGVNNQRVRNLFGELQKLPPNKFPNGCAFTFRSFLELSVYCFLDSKGEINKMQTEYVKAVARRNAGRPQDKQIKPQPGWTPTLQEMMARLADAKSSLLKNQHTVKALNKVIKEEQELFGLNLTSHNPTYHPNETRLRNTWANLEEFFKEILA
ncbi:MAG TPA: ParB N-terminal domain-containing protein [Chthoniobacterales bacterium]|nr:ParB N-terminal domain-containing protein [Chthoniobacterales bacterium]